MSIGHNNPPAPIETLRERVAAYRAELGGLGPVGEGTAQRYRDAIGYGSALAKEIDSQRDVEKRPHMEAGRAVDAAYKPLAAECAAVQKELKGLLQTFIAEREAEARRRAQEAIERARRAEEAALKALEEAGEDPFLEPLADVINPAAVIAEAKAAQLEASAASRVGSATGGFAAIGLKTRRAAVVKDAAALAAHYVRARNSDLLALLVKLANADVRHAKGAPIDLPGVKVVEERVL